MEFYTLLREMADSWGLLLLFGIFIAVVIMLFRPGASALHADAAMIPLRDDTIDREQSQPTANPQEEVK
ncbi:MAG: cbb3-type cytochrome c oxidase subunit 3 [Rhodobacteraceae bacterium]|nr:cbb3-type cytochrome c oxidase subunit 3 [Paracoccaceae bacterium]